MTNTTDQTPEGRKSANMSSFIERIKSDFPEDDKIWITLSESAKQEVEIACKERDARINQIENSESKLIQAKELAVKTIIELKERLEYRDAKLFEANEKAQDWFSIAQDLQTDLAKSTKENGELKLLTERLQGYVMHKMTCAVSIKPCECGLDELKSQINNSIGK